MEAAVRSSRRVVRDGSAHPAVAVVANLGQGHTRRSHKERDFLRLLGADLQPYMIDVTLEQPKQLEHGVTQVPMILPHELFAVMHEKSPCTFFKYIVGDQEKINGYWHEMRGQPFVNNLGLEERMLSYTIPILWHEDGVETFKNFEVMLWSWSNALLRGHSSLDIKNVCCFLPVQFMVKGTSHQEVVTVIKWSIAALASGRWPERDHLGRPWGNKSWATRAQNAGKYLAAGWRGVPTGWKGDMKQRAAAHKFARNYSSNFCCDLCSASKVLPELSMGDFGPDATWRDTILSQQTYLLSTPERLQSPWSSVVNLERFLLDAMHIIFLGVAQHTIASVLTEYAEESGEAPNTFLKRTWLSFRRWCKVNKVTCHVPIFTLRLMGRDNKNTFPELSSRVKAAHVKVLCFYIQVFTHAHCDDTEYVLGCGGRTMEHAVNT